MKSQVGGVGEASPQVRIGAEAFRFNVQPPHCCVLGIFVKCAGQKGSAENFSRRLDYYREFKDGSS
ncbi:hypothetical protein, partial [Streptomyces sp. NPDC005166]